MLLLRLLNSFALLTALVVTVGVSGEAQDKPPTDPAKSPSSSSSGQGSDKQINVNWLYGSYIPKDVPLQSLNRDERFKLYVRQTYTTPGIYIKTTAFAVRDQLAERNPEWGSDFSGFAKRFGDRQVQFIIQNSVISLGDGLLGWEPRYDRCRCEHFWPRTRHAIVRNFVTYDKTEKSLRPQLMPYLGAFGASSLATTWQPGNPAWEVRGYQAAVTQIFVGAGINWISEFAPEIVRVLRRKERKAQRIPDQPSEAPADPLMIQRDSAGR